MPGYIDLADDGTDPSTPPTGRTRGYFKDGAWCGIDDAGNIVSGGAASHPYIELRHRQNSGVGGGSSVASAWTVLPLNLEAHDTDNLCTLASNEFTLPEGTYELDAVHEFFGTNNTKIRLQNVTDSTTIALGTSSYIGSGTQCFLKCRFTLAATKTLRMEYYAAVGVSTTGLGVPAGAGADEIYAIVAIRKVG